MMMGLIGCPKNTGS